MKIGIFTIYIANYGAVLQAYALMSTIKEIQPASEVEIVDFYSHKPYKIFRKYSNNVLKNIIKNCLVLRHYSKLKRRNRREKDFLRKEAQMSTRVEYDSSFEEKCPHYDIYLTGSDQVFNLNSSYVRLFYQQFRNGEGVKAAYGSSFGCSNFSTDLSLEVPEMLNSFDCLSCREDDGTAFMKQVTGKNVPHVVDPTLLLSKEKWSKIANKPTIKNSYLLVYNLNGGQPLLDYARRVADKMGLYLVCITQHAEQMFNGVDKIIYDAGPKEFIGLFESASYVITDSFHGTMFSLIFEKKFNVFIAVKQSSRRILSVLERFGITDRLVETHSIPKEIKDFKLSQCTSFIEWQKSSLDYIRKIVKV